MSRQFDTAKADWRKIVAGINPAAATMPASFHTAQLLAARQQHSAALAVCREMLEQQPASPSVPRRLSALLVRMGKLAAADEYRRKAVKIELDRLQLPLHVQNDALQYLLAAEGLAAEPSCSPAGYIAVYFDRYAEEFDEYLVDELQYRGPQVVRDAVEEVRGGDKKLLNILDVGCGSGLAGALMRPFASKLDGVDLSAGMIRKARERELYDELFVGEMVELLTARKLRYDLVMAVDVFVYVGDLEPVIAACHGALTARGLLAFTIEAASEPGFQLCDTYRYVHRADYVRQVASRVGLTTALARETVLRRERGEPVHSLVWVLRKD